MASSLSITVDLSTNDAGQYVEQSGADKEGLQTLSNLFAAISAGHEPADVDASYTNSEQPVAASQTITLASVAEDDTVTIGGVTFTAKASPAGEVQFDQSGSDTADAADLAAKINAHSTLSEVVTATSAAAVVTVTAKVKGVIGNFITLAETGTTITLGAAALAGGTGGAQSAAVTFTGK